jgi:hypothetical protein
MPTPHDAFTGDTVEIRALPSFVVPYLVGAIALALIVRIAIALRRSK